MIDGEQSRQSETVRGAGARLLAATYERFAPQSCVRHIRRSLVASNSLLIVLGPNTTTPDRSRPDIRIADDAVAPWVGSADPAWQFKGKRMHSPEIGVAGPLDIRVTRCAEVEAEAPEINPFNGPFQIGIVPAVLGIHRHAIAELPVQHNGHPPPRERAVHRLRRRFPRPCRPNGL